MVCDKCIFQRNCLKEGLGTEDSVNKVVQQNRDFLNTVCLATKPRFEDKNNLLDEFKDWLTGLCDVLAVVYTIPMSEYFPSSTDNEDDNKENYLAYLRYKTLRKATFDRCINQTNMRTLTLGRASCGFVGQFSSGKSSCINDMILKGDVLPTAKAASTSIPTYIFPFQNEKLVYENMRGNIVVEDGVESIKKLAHSSNGNKECPCNFAWNSVIKRIYYFSNRCKYNSNMAFVDLPGYSANAADNFTMQEAVDGCDKIVYLKPVLDGDLNTTDLQYLKEISEAEKEVLVVISKVDQKSPTDCQKTLNSMKETLKKEEINVNNVILYTAVPDKIKSDSEFGKKLQNDRKIFDDFINDSSVVNDDLDFAMSVLKYYSAQYAEFISNISDYYDKVEKVISDFIGNKSLDNSFFDTWKRINKDFANTSGSCVEIHTFTKNSFRLNDYLNPNIQRANNYFNLDTYDSYFNLSYQYALLYAAMHNVYKTALYSYATGSADSNYDEACKTIERLNDNYEIVNQHLTTIQDAVKSVVGLNRNQYVNIINDIEHAHKKTVDAYSNLINYMKDYAKGWF